MVDITDEVKEDEYNEITFQLIDLADTLERFPITLLQETEMVLEGLVVK